MDKTYIGFGIWYECRFLLKQKLHKYFWGDPSIKEFRINPNIVPNPSPNFNRHFFELVQKSDDKNEKKISREWAKP